MKCWGGDFNSNTAVEVNGLSSGVTVVAAGYQHACAALATGGVRCWGNNEYGKLGDGTTISRQTPVAVKGITERVIALSIGWGHTCAALEMGRVKCWGYNGSGQLGNNPIAFSTKAMDVPGLSSVLSTSVEFYNPSLDYYFTTARGNEIALLDAYSVWQRTGKSFNVYSAQTAGSLGINRCYFDRIAQNQSRGSHFYSLVQSDKDMLAALNPTNSQAPRLPYNEGVDSYAYGAISSSANNVCGPARRPVYRLFRGQVKFPDNPNHRFTSDYDTYSGFVALGWNGEGVAFCVPY